MEDEENRPWFRARCLVAGNVLLDRLQKGRNYRSTIRLRGADRLDWQAFVVVKVFKDPLNVHGRFSANHLAPAES
jgi:hypothetical protein